MLAVGKYSTHDTCHALLPHPNEIRRGWKPKEKLSEVTRVKVEKLTPLEVKKEEMTAMIVGGSGWRNR